MWPSEKVNSGTTKMNQDEWKNIDGGSESDVKAETLRYRIYYDQ